MDLLFAQAGIKSLDDLRNHQDQLSSAQKIGLKYFEDFEKRIPRQEIKQVDRRIRDVMAKLDPGYIVTVCGSYRRGAMTSGDIDVLVTHKNISTK